MKYCFFLCLLTSCSFGYQVPAHIKRAEMLSARFSHKYQIENQVYQYCSGGGMSDSIERITCSYAGNQKIDVNEGRRRFVQAVEGLCATFNSDFIIRPYLHNYPFEIKNINMTLSFKDLIYEEPVPPPYISLIFCARNIVFYRTYNAQTQKYCKYYEEPYAEALRIVQEERSHCNLPAL